MSGAGAPRRRESFVWYRVAPARAAALRVDVERLQRALEAERPGLRARLLVHDVHGDGPQTWMETYAIVGAHCHDIDDALQARIEAAAAPLRDRLESDRHVERFDLVERA